MSNIPAARNALSKLAAALRKGSITPEGAAGAMEWLAANALVRRKPTRRAPAKARAPTPEEQAWIRQLAAENPDMRMQDIGELAGGFNQGRVSEALRTTGA